MVGRVESAASLVPQAERSIRWALLALVPLAVGGDRLRIFSLGLLLTVGIGCNLLASLGDDHIRGLMHQLAIGFRDTFPTTAAEPARLILDGASPRSGHRGTSGDASSCCAVRIRIAPLTTSTVMKSAAKSAPCTAQATIRRVAAQSIMPAGT